MSIDKRLISTGAPGVCTADTLDIFEDSSCVALYGLNYDASDASGNYDGTPTNVDFNAPGYIDYAASFNGSSNVDVGTIGGLLTSKVSSSISLWFNTSEASPNGDFLISTYTSSYFNYYVWLREAYGNLYVQFESRFAGNTTTIQVITPNINDGNWHHLVVMLDVPNLKNKMYIDGSFAVEGTISTSTASGSNGIIGGAFVGGIDQVRIFNKALSAAEVTTLYGEVACKYTCTTDTNGFPATASSDLVAYYKLDNDATDETGTHNATATNVTFDGGRYGAAASLNGSSSIDTGISTTNFVSDLNDRTVDFSFSAWTQIDSYPQGDNTIFYIGNYNVYSPNYAAIILDFRSGNKKIRFTHQTQYIESTSTFNSPTGWVHVVGVRESSVLKLYINGSLEANVTLTANTGVSSSTTLDLGGFKFGGATVYGGLDGKLDQIRMYNSALSSAEVSSLYEDEHQCYIAVDSTDPFGDSSNIALYEFENNANDSTGSYNGTASNVTYSTDSIIGTYAASFNGSNSNITTSMASSNFGTGGIASFSWWWKPNTSGTTVHFLFEGDVENTYGVHTGGGAGTLGLRVLTKNTGGTSTLLDVSNAYTTGVWQHHAVTIGGGEIKLYRNGSQIGSTTYSGTLASCNSFQIGKRSTSYYYSGEMDQFRIFNTVLNGDEIWKLYAEVAKG